MHVIIQVYTELSTYNLYQKGKEVCDECQISLLTKETKMEYTKRIRIISGSYIKLASTKRYNAILTNELQILNQLLET